jgi:hypothetical protein
MIDQTLFHYQVECAPASAIIYIGGEKCSPRDVEHLTIAADSLPPTIRMLRVDLHGVASMELEALMDLRGMMARWRTARDATVRLLVRSPLPREQWPNGAIHFARQPRLSLIPSQESRLGVSIRAMRARRAALHHHSSARTLNISAAVS